MITRFRELYATEAKPDPIDWQSLFAEFSQKVPYRGDLRHPGWSPAEFDPPKRSLDNCKRIHALVLDFDNQSKGGDRVADPVTIESITETLLDYYALIHTTRHHTRDWPRFRVILPLERPIDRLGYQVLWQAAARVWPTLDPAPKDPSRFWYTPGVADIEGAEFEALTIKGAYLNPDEFSKPIVETKPPPAAPSSLLETRARAYLEKMPAAISGAGGHNDLWRAARKLVCDFGLNEQAAFRILKTEYNPRCQPPWSDKEIQHKVQQALTRANEHHPIQDRPMPGAVPMVNLGEYEIEAAAATVEIVKNDAWKKNLRYDKNGQLTKDVGNVTLILKNEAGFRDCLRYDEMSYRCMWYREPSYSIGIEPPQAGEMLEDHHAVYVQQVLAKNFGLSVSDAMTWKALEAAAHEKSVHPVKEYLLPLIWDGVPRLSTWLTTYLGAPQTEYTQSVGRWWMISAVARALRAGCQVDHCLILEGEQGEGKSQVIKALSDPWYLGSLPDIRDRDRAADTIGGSWIVEIAELDAIKGASMTRVKEFLTLQSDKYRAAYARSPVTRPRSCVFFGTTNEKTYLSDPTGARRFWPVEVAGPIHRVGIERDRDQLWAEAVAAYRAGEKWYPEKQHRDMIEEEQSARYLEDDWTGIVRRFIKTNGASDEGFSCEEIMTQALNIEPRLMDRSAQTRIGAILTKLKCTRKRVQINGERDYRYFAPTKP